VGGDFNAVSGSDRLGFESIIGPYGSGVRNDNSARLLSFCAAGGLTVVGSWFKRRNIHRWSWISPDHHTKKEIDHFLLRDRRDATLIRVMRGIEAPANTDHKLVLLHFKISFPFVKARARATRRVNSFKILHDLPTRSAFRLELSNRFAALSNLPADDPNLLCSIITKTIHDTACSVAPAEKATRKPWLSAGSVALLEQKRSAMLRGDSVARSSLQKAFKDSACHDKEVYFDDLADRALAADRGHDLRSVFKTIHQISRSGIPNCNSHINKADGSPCDSPSDTLSTWQEHFNSALNHPPSLSPWTSIPGPPPPPVDSLPPPSAETIFSTISKLKTGRAPGPDGITAELLISSSDLIIPYLFKLFCLIWVSGRTPQAWKEGTIIPIYKGKGSKQTCANYRPITLLSVLGKLFATILLHLAQGKLLEARRPQQSGFTPGRSTSDAILSLRLLADLHRQFHKPLYVAFVDFKAAFDSVDRSALWSALSSAGLPTPIVDLIIDLHTGTTSCISVAGNLTPPFTSISGVRQGCVLAPSLFCLVMDLIMDAALPSGFSLAGSSFSDFVYADDVALVDHSLVSLSSSLARLQSQGSRFGLNISWTKTKTQNVGYGPPAQAISFGTDTVDAVSKFTYLGCSFESNASSHHDILRRIALASSVMRSLLSVWKQKRLSVILKFKLYRSLVLPVLTYASDTWTMLAADSQRIQSFHMQCQRQILGIKWYDLVSNEEVSVRSCMPSVLDFIRSRRLSLFGHVARFPPAVPAHSALLLTADISAGYQCPVGWRRPRGRPCKSWLDQILSDIPLPIESSLACALDRASWREETQRLCYAID